MHTLTEQQALVVRAVRGGRVVMHFQTGRVQTVIRGLVRRGILTIGLDGQVSVVAGQEG